jgi:hypothetical protein
MIRDHNNDPNAHLEEGQSLQSHKASEIIDHVARSVVRDKLKFNRFTIDEHFSTIDGWTKSDRVELNCLGCVLLETRNVQNDLQFFYCLPGDPLENQGTPDANPCWETRVLIETNSNQWVEIKQGRYDMPEGYGFYVDDDKLFAFYWDENQNLIDYEIEGVDITQWHIYRCEFKKGEYIKFYIDDVLKWEVVPNNDIYFFGYISYQIMTKDANYKSLWINNLHWDADYV